MQPLSRLIMVLLLLCSFSVYSINSTQQQVQISHPDFDEPFVFNVALPAGYDSNPDKSYVMMFDFHPFSDTYLTGMHDWLSHNGEWPWLQTIIVSPQAGNRVGMLFDPSGKSTPMLDFFEEKLFPLIDKKYRTNGFRIFSGFRVNGTIVLSSLINKPDLFNAHIAVSPELKDDYAAILSTSAKKLNKLSERPRFLLFSHGTNVKEDHQQQAYAQLKEILEKSAPKSLDWHYKHFSDHYFMSLPLLSVITGIEKLFNDIHQGLAPSSEISTQGVDAIIQHYQFLSQQKYGFEVSPQESIIQLGFYLIEQEPDKGINVFNQLIKRYPDDAYSYHHLAKAYAKLGNFSQAVKHQEVAVKLSESMLTWHQKRMKKALEEFRAKLAQ